MNPSGTEDRTTDAEPHPLLAAAPWLSAPATRKVLAALEADGNRCRVVGGAIRNTLIGLDVNEVDIATDARPEAVIALAGRARLKVVPTGLAHGTVTVIADATPFEVTTLRRDVETHGRHATVAFTDDWCADAERRDFTMNALYCDARGVLFDPVGGLADVERSRVRFIGDAHQRIREDYLRILRFFRFAAAHGEGIVDASGLEACIAERAGLARLSAERIHSELLRLLAARHVRPVLDVMHAAGLLADILGTSPDMRAFHRLHDIARLFAMSRHEPPTRARAGKPLEKECAPPVQVDALLGLAALAVRTPADAKILMQRLRLSRDEGARLQHAATAAADLVRAAGEPGTAARALITATMYRRGAAAAGDGLRLAWARSADPINDARWRDVTLLAQHWQPPRLPFTGADIVALGVAPGPRIGEVLRNFEAWWIAAGFPDDAERNAAELARRAMVTKP